jgi:hypothetical protein
LPTALCLLAAKLSDQDVTLQKNNRKEKMKNNAMNHYMKHIATKGRVDVGDYIVTQASNRLGRVAEVVPAKVRDPLPCTDYYRVRYTQVDDKLRPMTYDDRWTTLAVTRFAWSNYSAAVDSLASVSQ